MHRDDLTARAEAIGLNPSIAFRVLQPWMSTEIHEAEVRALRFLGFTGEECPSQLVDFLLGEQAQAKLPRGMFDGCAGGFNEALYVTPAVVVGVALAAQVYVYAHRNSCLIIPEDRPEALGKLGGRPASLYRVERALFNDLTASIDKLLDFGPHIGAKAPDGGADIVAWHPTGMGAPPFKALQAKRYARGKTAGLLELQKMRGMLIDLHERPEGVVTSSYFTGALPMSEAAPPFTAKPDDYQAVMAQFQRVFAGRIRWISPNMV